LDPAVDSGGTGVKKVYGSRSTAGRDELKGTLRKGEKYVRLKSEERGEGGEASEAEERHLDCILPAWEKRVTHGRKNGREKRRERSAKNGHDQNGLRHGRGASKGRRFGGEGGGSSSVRKKGMKIVERRIGELGLGIGVEGRLGYL